MSNRNKRKGLISDRAKGPDEAKSKKAGPLHTPFPDPTKAEQAAIAAAQRRAQHRESRVSLKIHNRDGQMVGVRTPHSDQEGWEQNLRDAFGTNSGAFTTVELARLLTVLSPNDTQTETIANAALAVLDGAHPRTEVEALLVMQMVGTHALAMELMGRTKRAGQLPQFEANGNMAVKLLRTFTAQAEALAKLRCGGEQTVRVEHVHVHPGGQAVVGNVNHHSTPGGGGNREIYGQAHATGDELKALASTPGSPVWRENPEREPLPIAESARQEPLQDARRRGG